MTADSALPKTAAVLRDHDRPRTLNAAVTAKAATMATCAAAEDRDMRAPLGRYRKRRNREQIPAGMKHLRAEALKPERAPPDLQEPDATSAPAPVLPTPAVVPRAANSKLAQARTAKRIHVSQSLKGPRRST
jgi:hypothetical protein